MTADTPPPEVEPSDSGDPPDPDELARLEEDIRRARSDAAEVVPGVDDEPAESFADSGDDPEDDDQAIAPG